jgi:hypothetical protein
MFMGLLFAAGTLISLTFGGLWLGSEEIAVSNAVTVFKQANILGTWAVTIPNITFFLVGARALMMMDFAFFDGILIVFQWVIFMVLGAGFLWGFYTVAIGVIQGLFGRR